MALLRFLQVYDNVTAGTGFWAWPLNRLGRYVPAFLANYLLVNTPNPALVDAIPDGGANLTNLPVGDMQEMTDQGNTTTDWIQTAGYAMEEFPVTEGPTGVAVVKPVTLPNYNQPEVIRELVGKMSGEQFAAWLKPFLNASTPSPGPTVQNPVPDQTITEGGNQVYTFPANTFSGTGLSYSATKADGSTLPISFNGATRSFSIGSSVPNGSFLVRLTATDSAGQSISTTFLFTIKRTATDLPYIQSIIRKFDPGNQTLYYLVKSSYQGSDTGKITADRSKRAEETAWRTAGQAFLPSQDNFQFPDDLANGYRVFWFGNLTQSGQPTTNVVVQFKPYADAPDSQILQLSYTHGSVADAGTEVYRYGAVSAKIKEFYVARIVSGSDRLLACYADGTGDLKTNLVATGGTPAFANGLIAMLTADGPYSNPLFTGTKPYGSLYRNVPNGTYNLSIIDENGLSETYAITITDSTPQSVLKAPTTQPNPPTPPPGGGSPTDLITPHTFTGTPAGGFASTDPNLFVLGYDFVNGRITNLRNTASPTLGSNEAFRAKINNHIYLYDAPSHNWYRINSSTGIVSGTPTVWSLNPETGLLIHFFKVNTTRSIMGSDGVPGQFDQPVNVASQLLRLL